MQLMTRGTDETMLGVLLQDTLIPFPCLIRFGLSAYPASPRIGRVDFS